MGRKIVSITTLLAFIGCSLSCIFHSPKREYIERAVAEKEQGKRVIIRGVLKKSGERIDFPSKRPGRIVGDAIVGYGAPSGKVDEIELDKADIIETKRDPMSRAVREVITKDGTIYRVKGYSYKKKGDKVRFKVVIPVSQISIPLSEIEMVWVRRVDPTKTFLATVGGIAFVTGAVYLIIMLTKESCPFIYSFDGEQYVFDAEPYGGAICEGLKRTEWCGLQYLQEADGQYKLLITNEVDETQYTDEVKLLVVDHPRGVRVVPDESGIVHTVPKSVPPRDAYDGKGRSLMLYVAENDWICWKTRSEEISADRTEDLKEELLFEFPKPEGATECKLLFNGCNTLWGSQMIKRFLELYGSEVDRFYEDMNARGPVYQQTMRWHLSEELYRLLIRVETEDGWKTKGALVGGGPLVSEDRIYTIDLRDVPGDTLRIKLTPPVAFWQINYLGVDYTEDLAVRVTEIAPIKAVDHKGRDVLGLLSETDSRYLVMPEFGDSAQVTFPGLPRLWGEGGREGEGMERSFILKASGYYDIHLDAEGEAQVDIQNRLFNEPGFTIRYSLQEYSEWKKENERAQRRQ